MTTRDIVLCNAVRTAISTYGGALKDIPASDLGATAVHACLERAKLKGSDIDTVVLGQVVQAGAKMNPARQAAIKAGIPVTVPAVTLNRVCGSGDLEYLAGAVAAGIAVGLAVPVVLTSRADPPPARLASLALAALVHHRMPRVQIKGAVPESSLHYAPQPEHACSPLPG